MRPQTVFILSASSDIGRELARLYADAGWTVVGTFRNRAGVAVLEGDPRIHLLSCDVSSPDSVASMAQTYGQLACPWDLFVSSVGMLDPIGRFFALDFDAWERSVIVNSTAQLRALHALHPYRRRDGVAHVAFFAGGGTNNPFPRYSAYCVSKILLIKMCELLDDENGDLNVFIVGPGFLPTKIHQPTLATPDGAGPNYAKTLNFFRSNEQGASYRDIFDCVNWCVEQGRPVAGGRNFSAVHDPWRSDGARLADALRSDRDKFKLRRHQNTEAKVRFKER